MSRLEVCNKCGQEFKYTTDMIASFSYGSRFDMETWEFNICDDCIKELMQTFVVVPRGFMVNGSLELTPEQHQTTFDSWRETGKWEEMMCIPYEELISFRDYYEDEYINNCIRKFHPDKNLLV